ADILVFVTVASDGLSVAELAELVGHLRPRVAARLGSAFGRTLLPVTVESMLHPDVVYTFAHALLLDVTKQQLGEPDLARYRDRILQWASGYHARGWPDSTPAYLLRGLGRLLAEADDLAGLTALVTDASWQRRFFLASGGDAAALAEIRTAE